MEIEVNFAEDDSVIAHYKEFEVRADQPAADGSQKAPEPFALFLASLATCASYYVLGFCRAREIDTTGLKIIQRTEFKPEGHGVAKIELKIILPAAFPEKYEKAIIRVADQCAVKKAILAPPEMVTVTARG